MALFRSISAVVLVYFRELDLKFRLAVDVHIASPQCECNHHVVLQVLAGWRLLPRYAQVLPPRDRILWILKNGVGNANVLALAGYPCEVGPGGRCAQTAGVALAQHI